MNSYKNTKAYWDTVFEHFNRPFPEDISTNIPVLDETILSVGKQNMNALDFGFGSGMVLLMLATHYTGTFTGIELSPKACDLATRLFNHYGIETATFIEGSFEHLKTIEDDTLDTFIASNILDNITKTDAQKLIEEAHRVLKPGGKMLVKLNDYYTDAQVKALKLKPLSDNFYEEPSGLYLYNLEDHRWKQLFAKYFYILNNVTFDMPQANAKNRLFVLKKNIE